MNEEGSSPFSRLPPWVWVIMALGGGGTIGNIQFGTQNKHSPTQELSIDHEQKSCQSEQEKTVEAMATVNGMIDSYQLLLKELIQCHTLDEQ